MGIADGGLQAADWKLREWPARKAGRGRSSTLRVPLTWKHKMTPEQEKLC